jgi:hypothetical protein
VRPHLPSRSHLPELVHCPALIRSLSYFHSVAPCRVDHGSPSSLLRLLQVCRCLLTPRRLCLLKVLRTLVEAQFSAESTEGSSLGILPAFEEKRVWQEALAADHRTEVVFSELP